MKDAKLNKKLSEYEIFDLLNKEKVEYTYRGKFDTKITDEILSLAETNLDGVSSLIIKKRIYFIIVESLQNITRHQKQNVVKENWYNDGFFVVQKEENNFLITTGNLVEKKAIPILRSQLETINKLSKDELKDFYRQILDNNTFSQKGGAGLGLIEIARKSGNKLNFDFQEVSDEHSYFYMQTLVNASKVEKEKPKVYLGQIKKIHSFFINQDILLNVTGVLNHEKLIYILSILEHNNSGKDLITKNKIFVLLIEMLQNVVKHAASYPRNEIAAKHSMFFITQNEHILSLNSGNYIKNDNVNNLKSYVDKINTMSAGELYKSHFEALIAYKQKKDSGGLGLIDMRLKSRNPLLYSFRKIDENYSFFSIKVSLNYNTKGRKKSNGR